MRIRKLHIKNLKSIKNLEIAFDDEKAVALLYGNNGVGKTTILEAISLIGHLSTMRRIAVPDALSLITSPHCDRDSVFIEKERATYGFPAGSEAFEYLKANLGKSENLESWFDRFSEPGAAAICFDIKPGIPLMNETLRFYVYFKQDRYSITQALSKKSSDDLEMNDLFAVVFAESSTNGMDLLTEHFFRNTSHLMKTNTAEKPEMLVGKGNSFEQGHDIVSYINTDLNDFGRKNDVRESVKDIFSDFGQEIVGRLALPFDGGASKGEFRFKADLNQILDEVIKDYTRVPYFGASSETQPLFNITELYCALCAGDQYVVRLFAQRHGEESKPLDHMSAGENECFFIFMLLLGLPIQNSIILLDEPDLHLTTYAKETFYRNLFKIMQDKQCQVIISTHSLFAYFAHKAVVERLLIKRDVKDGVPSHSATFDSSYFYRLHKYYVRTAIKALRVIEKKMHFRYRWRMWLDNVEERQGASPAKAALMWNLLISLVPIGFAASGALVNDLAERYFGQSLASHGRWIKHILDASQLLVVLVGFYWALRFLFKRKASR